jgi:hypothetical protein
MRIRPLIRAIAPGYFCPLPRIAQSPHKNVLLSL